VTEIPMNPFQPSPLPFWHHRPALFDDVEMLQTDVMRFFAILCLCLMAIFALVKALPMAPPPDRPTLGQPTDLKAEARALQTQVSDLEKKFFETQAQLQAAAQAAEQSSSQAIRAAENERQVLTRLSQARQALAEVSQSLNAARGELKTRERNLAGIVADIDGKIRLQTELTSQIAEENHKLTKIRAALQQAQDQLDGRVQPSPEPEHKMASSASPPRSARQGFTLRFASESALQKLISGRKVLFYALAGRQAWQLQLKGAQPAYVETGFPRQIYEMEPGTVPVDFTDAFARQVAAFGRGTVTWGVTLPERTTDTITRLIKDRNGGDLVIMPDGEVMLN
jgi:hypothetical protein